MIKLFIDFIQFLYALAPLLASLAVLTLLAVLLSKSIKRYAAVYYIAFAIPFALVAIPFICRLLGMEMFNFSSIPFLGGILRDYIHMGTLGFPLLVIIMYTGALNPKNPTVKKLLSIRKELSILSGFPILTHSLIRVTNNFPNALKFFTDNEDYMAGTKVTSALGAGITSFSFVLGILMLAIFIPLWITSFDAVRKRMGNIKWKKLQQWAYVLYAMLFIHAIGIQAGAMLNPREREAPMPAVEMTAAKAEAPEAGSADNQRLQQRTERGGGNHANRNAVRQSGGNSNQTAEAAKPQGRGGRPHSTGFDDIKVSPQAKQYIHIASLLLIFGSYLYFRLRKAKQESGKKISL
jgi:DMSO/TMAO reductase YedYZ heme-binding membrane subunit